MPRLLGKALAGLLVLGLVAAASAGAASLITGADVQNGTLTGKDLKQGSVKFSDLSDKAKGKLDRAGPGRPRGADRPAGPRRPGGRARQRGPLRRVRRGRHAQRRRAEEHHPGPAEPRSRRRASTA